MGKGREPGPRKPGGWAGKGSARSGYFGGTPADVRRIREWCLSDPRIRGENTFWVQLVASEIATNAVRHTASGEKFGRVGVSLDVTDDGSVLFGLVDQGPRWGRPLSLPRLVHREADDVTPGGRGLWLVDHITDHWWWEGRKGLPLMTWALVPLRRGPDPNENHPNPLG